MAKFSKLCRGSTYIPLQTCKGSSSRESKFSAWTYRCKQE